jgi:hypothetical protein
MTCDMRLLVPISMPLAAEMMSLYALRVGLTTAMFWRMVWDGTAIITAPDRDMASFMEDVTLNEGGNSTLPITWRSGPLLFSFSASSSVRAHNLT